MPSEDRIALADNAIANEANAFCSALATTLEQVRDLLSAHAPSANGSVDRFRAELGEFSVGRIHAERFAALFEHEKGAVGDSIEHIELAFRTLAALRAENDLFHVSVPDGGNLRDVVDRAMRHLGTAFGAARVVSLARAGRYREAEHATLLDGFPFERWNGAERRMAPPVVVEVGGGDLRPSGLADYLDAAQKIVLVVHGECPPAALVRLVSPGIFVLQTVDETGLDRFAAADGPGVAALVPDTAARFTHDPSGGSSLVDRVQVDFLPDKLPRRTLAGLSAAQQAEDLAQLAALSTASAAQGPSSETTKAVDPAEKLAAWLLRQADETVVK